MAFALIAAGVTAAVGVASTAASLSAQSDQANAQNKANNANTRAGIEDRHRAITYAEEVFEADRQFAYENLDFQKEEFTRQNEKIVQGRETIARNTSENIAAILTRQIEEDMAVILGAAETRRAGASMRGTIGASNADRGVEGHSVDAVLQDVFRQEGEAMTVMAMNRSATDRVLTNQAIAARAQGTQQMMDMPVQTFGPQQRLRTMGTMGSVPVQAQVQGPNVGMGMALGIGNAAVSGFNAYNSWTGGGGVKAASQTFNHVSSWLGRQFTITPSGGS